ncbi:MAG: hypothetical protein K9G76_07610 [Bacteroidales bacterium]|nr:hypothetical protein [Bacteroidales bacterium]MCF8405445.1 hypothetical protein [Bacteroidales bacterium]
MELITLGIGFIVNTFAKNKEVHSVVDDFVTQSAKWVRGWFVKNDQEEVIKKLEEQPDSEETKATMNSTMQEMIKDDQFKLELEKWVSECQKPLPSMKNVLENVNIEVAGNINFGDKGGSDQVYDQKNIMRGSNIKGGGDFNFGDSNISH